MSQQNKNEHVILSRAPFTERRRKIVSLMRHRDGAVAAEFAMVLPVLMSLLFGTIEFGTLLYSYSSMQMAARDVTRQMAVNALSTTAGPVEIKSRLPEWMRNTATIQVVQTTPADPSTNVFITTLEIDVAQATPISFFTKAMSRKLRTDVEMKQELPFIEPPKV